MFLNQRVFCPPGDNEQCSETFWAVTTRGQGPYSHLVGRFQGAAKHPTMGGIAPHARIIQAQRQQSQG